MNSSTPLRPISLATYTTIIHSQSFSRTSMILIHYTPGPGLSMTYWGDKGNISSIKTITQRFKPPGSHGQSASPWTAVRKLLLGLYLVPDPSCTKALPDWTGTPNFWRNRKNGEMTQTAHGWYRWGWRGWWGRIGYRQRWWLETLHWTSVHVIRSRLQAELWPQFHWVRILHTNMVS